ncbi:MAG: helix-turn-helix domain-containing protein, partial [Hymenobacter sp.]
MAGEQPWLEPELTLPELAHRLRTHPALLSKIINASCGQNFNDFVNTYRTQEAQRKLADPRFAHYSLMGVALESGFNSKSTFNRVFRKLPGHGLLPAAALRPPLLRLRFRHVPGPGERVSEGAAGSRVSKFSTAVFTPDADTNGGTASITVAWGSYADA